MLFADVLALCKRSRPFLGATLLFAVAFGIDLYIAMHYWSILGARMVVAFSLPIGLHLPLTWWRLGSCIRRSADVSDARRSEASDAEFKDVQELSLSDLSFWLAFLPSMSLFFLLFVLRRCFPS